MKRYELKSFNGYIEEVNAAINDYCGLTWTVHTITVRDAEPFYVVDVLFERRA